MRKHGSTASWRDKHVTLPAISPPGVARGRFVGGHQSGLAGCKPPPLSRAEPLPVRHRADARGNHGAPLHDRVHLPIYLPLCSCCMSSSRRLDRSVFGYVHVCRTPSVCPLLQEVCNLCKWVVAVYGHKLHTRFPSFFP